MLISSILTTKYFTNPFPGYPRFLTRLFNKKVIEGEAVTILCQVDGTPDPQVFWTLNGRNLDDKINHIQVEFIEGRASLTILHAYCDDEGEYLCRAYNSCGSVTSRCFLSVIGINAPPSAPTELKCVEVNSNYLIISWKPPGYCGHFGGAPVSGYIIEKAIAGSSVWTQAKEKPIKLAVTPISGLEEGQAYFFRVRAFNRWGRSPASLPIGPIALRDGGAPRLAIELAEPGTILPPNNDNVDLLQSTSIPEVPRQVSVSSSPCEDTVIIKWASPNRDHRVGFFIEYQGEDNDTWITTSSDPLFITDAYPVSGLQKGKFYRFRMRATNGVDTTEPSECTEAFLVGDTHSPYMECEVFSSDTTGETGDLHLEQSLNLQDENQHPEEHLQLHKYRGTPTPPREVQCLKAKREYIEVGWIPPAHSGGTQVEYFVEYRKLGQESWRLANQSPIRFTQYPVSELDEGDSYMFRVRCVNKHGTSVFSEPSEPILASDGIKVPNWWGGMQGLFKVAEDEGKPCITRDSIKVCWDPPTTDGGSNVIGYYLECRPCGGKFRPVNNKPINQRHFTVDGLNTGEYYQFRIRSCNEVGCGDWKMMPGRIQAKDPECPSDPTDVIITDLGEESVSLEWKKPKKLGDGEMIGYIVERRKEEVDFWIPCNKLPEQIQNEHYTISGLIQGQTYFFRVRAVNQIGEGENSLQSCYVTIGEPLEDVQSRQNAIFEMKRKKKEIELERRRLLEEEDKKEAFLTKIEDCYTSRGGQAHFKCTVKDKRTKVSWYLGNWKEIPIAPEGKYDVICSGRRRALIINNCNESDVQAVHCVAMYNQCSCVADLMVDGMFPVRFIRFPTDIYIKTGERATFDCVLSKATAEVTWQKFDDVISHDDDVRYELINQGCGRSLIIHDTMQEDIALYTIKGLGGSITVNLVLDGGEMGGVVLPVKIEKDVSSESLPHTADVALFNCVANPSPLYEGRIPPAEWYHNGDLIEPGDDRYEIISDGNIHTLKIINPTYEDNGEILCVIGGGRTCCDIYIEKPPPPPPKTEKSEDCIINFQQGLKAEALASAVRLYCIASNLHEEDHIIWYQNDVEITKDQNIYKTFNNVESGLVSLVISPITDDLEGSKFTCEFITPRSTFDTKVNLELDQNEFKKLVKEASSLFAEEEKNRLARKQERERLKQERKRKAKEIKTEGSEVESLSVPGGIDYNIDENGTIEIRAKVNLSLEKCEVVWLKDSEPVQNERISSTTSDTTTALRIESPCSDDAGTYTCQLTSGDSKCEASTDFTGKVFKEFLLKSAELRIKPLADCDAMIEQDVLDQANQQESCEEEDEIMLEEKIEEKKTIEDLEQTHEDEINEVDEELVKQSDDKDQEEEDATITDYLWQCQPSASEDNKDQI